ncbi:MAG: ABC transporter ATP-binding protein [Pedosphaera sp.]|nr:ABC transporter ATP-binding protein [Pedosphaera sp.]
MRVAIETRQLTKAYGADLVAVDRLDLQIKAGSVYGLIGRNGAGKTTTLRMLMGLVHADSGTAQILGQDLWKARPELRQKISYVSQGHMAPDWMTLEDLYRYSAHFFDRWDQEYARSLARRWDLPSKRALGKLSGGTQRLVALATAIAARPEILILDEPASGLDPVARRALRVCLTEILSHGDGATLLLSTHLLPDLERLASHVGIMDQGRMVAEGSVEDWQRALRRVQVVFEGTHPPADFVIPGAIRTRTTGPVVTALVRIENEFQLDPVRQISGSRVFIFTLSLEEIFVEFFDSSISSVEC